MFLLGGGGGGGGSFHWSLGTMVSINTPKLGGLGAYPTEMFWFLDSLRWLVVRFGGELVLKWFNIQILCGEASLLSLPLSGNEPLVA